MDASFAYLARSAAGGSLRGSIVAASVAEARQTLREQGLFVLELQKAGDGPKIVAAARSSGGRSRKIRKRDVMLLLSQLHVMSQAGVEIAEALKSVAIHVRPPSFRAVIERISEDVHSGISFSSAVGRHGNVFSPAVIAGLAAGEKTGDLPGVMGQLVRTLRNEMRMASNIRGLLIYPAVLSLATILVLAVITFFVLPQFATIFAGMDQPPPMLTQMVIGFGTSLRQHWYIVAIAVGGVFAIGYNVRNAPWLRLAIDRWLLKGKIPKHAAGSLLAGRFCRELGTLLANSVPLLEAIQLCHQSIGNRVYKQLLTDLEAAVLNGRSLASVLGEKDFMPIGVPEMIRSAESSGRLSEVLMTIGEFYEEEGEKYLRDVVKLAEPMLILGLGAVVAAVVLTVLIPMLDVTAGASG